MLQNRKLQILILALFIGGAWWMNKSPAPVSTQPELTPSAAVKEAMHATPAHALAANAPAAAPTQAHVIETPKLRTQIKNIALSMQHPELPMSPDLLDVSHITPEEMNALSNLALDVKASDDMRSSALFLLTKIGYPALKPLAKVAMTSIPALPGHQKPHSPAAAKYESEISLRITAIESMDKMTTHTNEIKPLLEKTLQAHTDPTLTLLLNIGLGGIEEGRPGKIGRAIEAMIQEKTL